MNISALKELRERNGLSREEFANKIGITIETLNSWEYRKKNVPENKVAYILSLFNENTEAPKISYNKTEGRPFYPVDWTLGLEENIIDDEIFHPEFNIDFQPANKESITWYTASGNSMIGEIDAGSYIAMEEILDFSWFPLGQIYGIVTTNGMRTIKRVVASDNKDCYLLKSSNPDKENYPDQNIPKKMIKRVFRVLWVIRKLD